MKPCIHCGKLTDKPKWCSKECHNKPLVINLICQRCGKAFTHNRSWDIKIGRKKYCSTACVRKTYYINENYFDILSKEELITLGQIFAIGYIFNFQTIALLSDMATLEDISRKMQSTYVITKSDRGKFRLNITSLALVNRLLELGLASNQMYQEYGENDILTGLMSTDCYSKNELRELHYEDGVFSHKSLKLVMEVARLSGGGEVVSRTYKDTYKGCLSIVYLVSIP